MMSEIPNGINVMLISGIHFFCSVIDRWSIMNQTTHIFIYKTVNEHVETDVLVKITIILLYYIMEILIINSCLPFLLDMHQV